MGKIWIKPTRVRCHVEGSLVPRRLVAWTKMSRYSALQTACLYSPAYGNIRVFELIPQQPEARKHTLLARARNSVLVL